jgi:hypothetical protein
MTHTLRPIFHELLIRVMRTHRRFSTGMPIHYGNATDRAAIIACRGKNVLVGEGPRALASLSRTRFDRHAGTEPGQNQCTYRRGDALRPNDDLHDPDDVPTLQRLERPFGRGKPFCGLFRNRWLWAAIPLSLFLHAAVVYVPFLQEESRLAASTPAIGFSARRSQVLYCGSAN